MRAKEGYIVGLVGLSALICVGMAPQSQQTNNKTLHPIAMPAARFSQEGTTHCSYIDPITGRVIHSRSSKSGVVRYGSASNGIVFNAPLFIAVPNFSPPRHPDLSRRVWGRIWYGARLGYVAYVPGFVDDLFSYPFYAFEPDSEQPVVLSPWYYYPSLPPYIDSDRTESVQDQPSAVDSPPPVPVEKQTQADNDTDAASPPQNDLDHAISDLVTAWQDDDGAAMDRLVASSGTVTVVVAGQSPYALDVKDFNDLMHDGIDGVKTVSFVVDPPQMTDSATATFTAHHTFLDPWSLQRTLDQTYTLIKGDSGWTISKFSSASYK